MVSEYTPEMLKAEAKAAAVSHAKEHQNGRAFGVRWFLVVGDTVCLSVSYAANGRDHKCGVYYTSVAI